jgi:hypothetical protein
MGSRLFDRLLKATAVLLLIGSSLALSACTSGTICALFGLQCGAPSPEQQARAADDQARLKQEDAVLGPRGHYGTPYGGGPQYGEGGGDQYGYGPAYSYARQAPEPLNGNEPRE